MNKIEIVAYIGSEGFMILTNSRNHSIQKECNLGGLIYIQTLTLESICRVRSLLRQQYAYGKIYS